MMADGMEKASGISSTLEQVRAAIDHHLAALWAQPARARVLPPLMLWGPPGVGKSAVVRQACERHGIGFLDVRLSQREPVDVRGLPVPRDGVVQWLLPDEYPRDPGGRGIILFDELTAADRTLQVAAYEFILDRRLGSLSEVPPGWYLMAAGNRTSDRAAATTMSAALANRFCHLDVRPDIEGWVRWAQGADVHPDVVAFLRFRPQLFLDMKGDLERGWPSPRSWERVGLETALAGALDPATFRALLAGLVGPGAAREYLAFREWQRELPAVGEMLAGRAPLVVPERPDRRYALCSAVVWHLWRAPNPRKALDVLFAMAEALPADFATLLVVDAMNGGTRAQVASLVVHPGFAAWGSRCAPALSARVAANASALVREVLRLELPPELPLAADLMKPKSAEEA
jgi:hypothetical protein